MFGGLLLDPNMRVLLGFAGLPALLLVLALPAAAQTRGTCSVGQAMAFLDDGDVRARLLTHGSLFASGFSSGIGYEVPRGSGRSPLYAASLWVSGRVGSDVRTAGTTYYADAYFPGPLQADGSPPNPSDCSAYDRIYVVSAADVAAYDAGAPPTPDLADWPVALGADIVDGDGVPGNYDLAAGDRPRLIGTQTAFWVVNDVAGPAGGHATETPVGVEVQVTAAAFDSPDPVFGQATFYRFRLVKRTPGTLEDARVGFWLDPDIGAPNDDFAAVDTTRGMAVAYNSTGNDPGGYGLFPPAIGFDLLTGAGAHVVIGRGPGTPRGEAFTAEHLRNYSLGRWRDGSPVREGGTGAVTTWTYAGDPVSGAFWSERNTDGAGTPNSPGDLKHAISSAALTLVPGQPLDVVLAIPFAQGTDYLDSITQLRAASDALQAAYDSGVLFPVVGEDEAPDASALVLSSPRPNPTTGASEVTLTLPEAGDARVRVVDVLGRTVAVLRDGPAAAGATALRVPAGLAPGVYTVVAESGDGRAAERLTVAR